MVCRYRQEVERGLAEATGLSHITWRRNEAMLRAEGLDATSGPEPTDDAPKVRLP